MSEAIERIEAKIQAAQTEIDRQHDEAVRFYAKRRKEAKKLTNENLPIIRELRIDRTPSGEYIWVK